MEMISDEIREFVRRSYADEHMDPRELLALADRIDAELVELPKDADGVPIHVGDTVYLDDEGRARVTRIELLLGTTSIVCWASGKDCDCLPSAITHTAPDSWESIAQGLEDWAEDNRFNSDGDTFDLALDFADRVRKLAKKEDGDADGAR